MLDVTVITPSIPSRLHLLTEAMASVHRQTVQPAAHLVMIESEPVPGEHPMEALVRQRNLLAQAVDTEWVATLDDDDLYLPSHFEAIEAAVEAGEYPIIYTDPVERERTPPPFPDDIRQFETRNYVTSNACIRVDVLEEVGWWSSLGFDPDTHTYRGTLVTAEDWHLWGRMARAGHRFLHIPRRTWHYRTGDWHRLTEDIGG